MIQFRSLYLQSKHFPDWTIFSSPLYKCFLSSWRWMRCLLTVHSEAVFKRTHVGLIVIQENTVMIGRYCGRSWGYSNPPSIKLFPKLFEDKTDRFIATVSTSLSLETVTWLSITREINDSDIYHSEKCSRYGSRRDSLMMYIAVFINPLYQWSSVKIWGFLC